MERGIEDFDFEIPSFWYICISVSDFYEQLSAVSNPLHLNYGRNLCDIFFKKI